MKWEIQYIDFIRDWRVFPIFPGDSLRLRGVLFETHLKTDCVGYVRISAGDSLLTVGRDVGMPHGTLGKDFFAGNKKPALGGFFTDRVMHAPPDFKMVPRDGIENYRFCGVFYEFILGLSCPYPYPYPYPEIHLTGALLALIQLTKGSMPLPIQCLPPTARHPTGP